MSASVLALLAALAAASSPEGPEVLQVGHWVELKGRFDEHGTLVVSAAELAPAARYEVLTGTVPEDQRSWERFVLLGLPVEVDADVRAEGLPADSPAGLRLQVEGRYRGPHKFSSREIEQRKEGREAVEGRIDHLERVPGGFSVRVMNTLAFVPDELEISFAAPLAELELIPPRAPPPGSDAGDRPGDADDEIRETIALGSHLFLGGQVEWRSTMEDELDLDEGDDEDRVDHEAALRLQLHWLPPEDVEAVATWRRNQLWRNDDEDGREQSGDGRLGETWVRWDRLLGQPLSLALGRQDFDDEREWLYDEDLDAVRFVWSTGPVIVDLSASTVLADGSDREEDTRNLIAYVSNDDDDRHLAAYVVDRRDETSADDSPIHFGMRALGEWLPANDSWAELALVKGFRGDVDLEGYGLDVGTTIQPEWLGPFDFTCGWAFGRGDDPATVDQDESFVQTGLQDNNDAFGGVTSFRYYGELVDPELSNLSILTIGTGVRLAERTSLDLVWHGYRQDVAADRLRDSELDRRPNGLDRDLGSEVDLILGCREFERVDIEISAGWFSPGAAFPGGDDAFVGKFQLRYKF